jgi:hypothetical protein
MVSPAKIIHRRSPYPGLSGIDSRQAGYGCLGLRQRHDVEPVRAGAFRPWAPVLGAMPSEYRLRGDRGSWTERSAGVTQRREERLRGRTAERLNGDPRDLIRAMPAKGDTPQAVF